MARFNTTIVNSLVILIALLFSLASPAFAQTGDGTTTSDLDLIPTYECISVYAPFSGDNNGNNSAELYYRTPVGSGTWIRGMDMTPDRRDRVYSGLTNTYKNQWRASVLGLDPDTEYEVRVTFSDGDGISGTNPVTETVRTRDDNPPSNGDSYYVATNGNDTSGDGSEGSPWRTIQHGVNQLSAGDTLYVKAGTYDEGGTLTISSSGVATNYITVRSYPGDDVTIDASSHSTGIRISGSYIRFKGFELIGGTGSGIIVSGHDCIIEDNIVRDVKTLTSAPHGYWAITLSGYSNPACRNHTVQNNDIYVVEPGATSAGSTSGPGIVFEESYGGHVIRYNNIYFTGTTNVHGRDGINNTPNFEYEDTVRDSDIYGNYIEGATDDGISLDGNSCNVRVWNNTITGTAMGVSIAPVIIGPAYIFRNVFYDPEEHWVGSCGGFKEGESGDGHVYVYHNTIAYDVCNSIGNYGFNNYGGSEWFSNVFSRNNIIFTDGPIVGTYFPCPDMDYDLMYDTFDNTSKSYWAKWNGNSYGSLNSFNSGTGQEAHGVAGQPTFVDRANGDFSLANGSPGIDQGVLIYGFNDANSPWPYKGSTPDIGAFEYGNAESVPPYTSGHSPAADATDVYPNTNIVVHVQDDDTGVDQSTIVMTVEGTTVSPTISGTPSDYTLTYDPLVDFSPGQVVDVTVEAQDRALTPNLVQDSYSFTILADAGSPPVLDPIGDKTVAEGDLLTFTVDATDSDGPSALAYSASNLPSGASFNTGNHVFSWTPSYTQAGSYTDVHFEVTDGWNSVYENITITATNTNQPPQANAGSNQEVSISTLVTLDGSGSSDPDGDTISSYLWTQTSGPTAALSDNTTSMPTFTPTETGTYIFSLVVNDGILDSSPDSVTITVNPSGGGGGGGGGGGAPGITFVIDYVTSDGRFADDVEAQSDDGKAVLYIHKDTIGLNRVGFRLTSITVIESSNYPAPPKLYKIIPPVYHMEPVGATFEPAIDLTINYNDSLIPELLAEKNLVVATCDTSGNKWEILDSIVDQENDTIMSKVGHFSFFAVMAPLHPASFEINEFYVTPEQAEFGETVKISAVITNTGALTGSHEYSIKLDGELVETRQITLDGGESQTVSFNVNPETSGVHEASIGELSSTFTVQEPKAPASFSISDLTVNAAEINLGESVEISALITNTSDLSGSYDVILKMNDTIMESKQVTLDGGGDTTVIFSVTPQSSGEHSVNIGDLFAVFVVKEPPTATTVSPEIKGFGVTPIYDHETGKLVSARIDYQVNGTEELTPESKLVLKILHEGEPLEEILLLSANQLQSNESTGSQGYVPSLGWNTGLYTFYAELTDGESPVQSTEQKQFTVTPESLTKAVSWRTLGIVIGSVFISMAMIVALIIYRRRNLLFNYNK